MIDSLNIQSPKRRSPQSQWNECFPYYAGFPERFASDIIKSSGLSREATVFDPWNGSGTTTYAACRLGFNSCGTDINPVMVLVAKSRSLQSSEADSILPQASSIVKGLDRIASLRSTTDALAKWFTADTARLIRGIERRIRNRLVSGTALEFPSNFGKISCFAATFYVALFTICRRFTSDFRSSNPTWLKFPKQSDSKISLSAQALASAFIEQARAMAASLQLTQLLDDIGVSDIIIGNTTMLRQTQFADLIITSPPYCTRIDYTAATRIELAIVEPLMSETASDLSKGMLGSIKVPDKAIAPSPAWGETCLVFLDRVASHPSKASAGYYLKTHLDYFDKLSKSISNLRRALKEDGAGIFVVQDSYYKEIHNNVPQILTEMADRAGLELRRQEQFSQNNPMSTINARAKLYRAKAGATEAVLCFQHKAKKGKA